MMTDTQLAILEPILDDFALQLRNGNTPNCKLSYATLLHRVTLLNILNLDDLAAFLNSSLDDPLFKDLALTALPYFIDLLHSHQPDPGVPETL